jgi:hypothetical protein
MAAQEMLRHAEVAVTAAHYVENTQRPVLGFGPPAEERAADDRRDRRRESGGWTRPLGERSEISDKVPQEAAPHA